jgi:hypothetical protein
VTVLNQLFGTQLYAISPSAGNQGWLAYLLPPNSGYTGTTITLDNAWSNSNFKATGGGVFVFSSTVPTVASASDADLIVNILPKSSGIQTSGFLSWVNFGTGSVLKPTLTTTLNFISSMSATYNPIDSMPLSFQMSKSVTLALNSGCNVAFANDLFTITPAGAGLCQVLTNFGGNALKFTLASVIIPCYGPEQGCCKFDLAFSAAAFNFPMQQLGAYYYYGGGKNKLFYPLMEVPATDNFHVTVDPTDLLNTTALRTYYLFAPLQFGNSLPVSRISNFSTDTGWQITLQPLYNVTPYPDAPGLVFPATGCALVVMQNVHTSSDYDFTPSGNFYISIAGKSPTSIHLLCGLSGVETISCTPAQGSYDGDFLSFQTGQAANALAFPPAADASAGSLLDKTRTTSWVAVQPSSKTTNALNYFSQPKGASLYALNSGAGNSKNNFLGFYEPVAANLADTTLFMPMAPYTGVQATGQDQQTIADFESTILSPSRKGSLSDTAKKNLADARLLSPEIKTGAPFQCTGTLSTSPQGLLVCVNSNWGWDQLILAKNQTGKPVKNYVLDFEYLNPILQNAFQTNQQFLVISQNTQNIPKAGDSVLGTFNSEMSLDGWPFLLNVPTADTNGDFNNVLLFKFCNGALIDRVGNPGSWTAADDFNITDNEGLTNLSSWLKTYIQQGIDNFQVNKDPNFQYFATIVQDPNWQGILALKTGISLQDFPLDLQGLLGGIDLSLFYGHHFGINVNYVVPQGGTLFMNPVSSMFGLIDYTDPLFASCGQNLQQYKQIAQNSGGDYDFRVLTLKVLFGNSKIQSFQSYVQLTVNKLFGDTVQAVNNNNMIIFTGSYENHNGTPAYVFNETEDILLAVNNQVWNGVEIVKGNFSTVVPQSTGGGGATVVNAIFSFWGFLNFKALEGFDLFSFGSDTGFQSHDGLSYSALEIHMSFDLNTPSVKTFSFDVSHMAFDLGQSISRDASFYPHFPLQVIGITSGKAESLPPSQGYLAVTASDLASFGTPQNDWYGLVFNLNMGTLGALASSAGFSTTFLASWGVDDGGVGTGIKLPGVAPQAKMLSLQGVLNLSFGSIKLVKGVTQGDNPTAAYLLMMNSIALKFLGLKFPPNGNINFYLFGDPAADAQPGSLGWYLAYKKDSQAQKILS